jgi:hypothetical protein
MAIAHISIQSISRSGGLSGNRNISASVAYRTGDKIRSAEDGLIKYPHRKTEDIEATLLINNPYSCRAELWREAEKAELKKNGEIKQNPTWAREIMVAIPRELSRQQRFTLIKDYSEQIADKYNLTADASIHTEKDGNGNFHAHILLTTRNIENSGLGKKDRRFNGREASGTVKDIRNKWKITANRHLEQAGIKDSINTDKTEKKEEDKQIHHFNNPGLRAKNEIIKKRNEILSIERELSELNERKKEVSKILSGIKAENERNFEREIDKALGNAGRASETLRQIGCAFDVFGEAVEGREKERSGRRAGKAVDSLGGMLGEIAKSCEMVINLIKQKRRHRLNRKKRAYIKRIQADRNLRRRNERRIKKIRAEIERAEQRNREIKADTDRKIEKRRQVYRKYKQRISETNSGIVRRREEIKRTEQLTREIRDEINRIESGICSINRETERLFEQIKWEDERKREVASKIKEIEEQQRLKSRSRGAYEYMVNEMNKLQEAKEREEKERLEELSKIADEVFKPLTDKLARENADFEKEKQKYTQKEENKTEIQNDRTCDNSTQVDNKKELIKSTREIYHKTYQRKKSNINSLTKNNKKGVKGYGHW